MSPNNLCWAKSKDRPGRDPDSVSSSCRSDASKPVRFSTSRTLSKKSFRMTWTIETLTAACTRLLDCSFHLHASTQACCHFAHGLENLRKPIACATWFNSQRCTVVAYLAVKRNRNRACDAGLQCEIHLRAVRCVCRPGGRRC